MTDKVLILDTETTGIGPDAVCIEVAVCLYSLTHAAAIRSFSSLIRADSNAAEHVNRIPAAMLADAPEPGKVWPFVARMVAEAGVIVAHNAEFDRRFVPNDVSGSAAWVCSKDDIAWPVDSDSKSLVNIALAHGLGVATAHRAAADVELLARLFTRAAEMGGDLAAMVARGMRPKSRYQALVPFERNHEAKAAGFRWDGDRKAWLRSMADEDTAALPFKVRRIDT